MNDDHAIANAILAHAAAISTLAESIDHLAAASQALRLPGVAKPPMPGGVTSPIAGQPPGVGPPVDDTKTKMGKKVYAICMQQGWDIATVGQQILERPVGGDSRKWTQEDLSRVLDFMKDEWSVG